MDMDFLCCSLQENKYLLFHKSQTYQTFNNMLAVIIKDPIHWTELQWGIDLSCVLIATVWCYFTASLCQFSKYCCCLYVCWVVKALCVPHCSKCKRCCFLLLEHAYALFPRLSSSILTITVCMLLCHHSHINCFLSPLHASPRCVLGFKLLWGVFKLSMVLLLSLLPPYLQTQ